MPTIEEIRTEWHGVRSAVGTLVSYIDGKVAQLQDMSEAYRKGYNEGIEKCSLDMNDRVSCAYQRGYAEGLEDAWETACRIVQMDVHKRAEVFFSCAEAVTHDEPFKHYSAEEAMQKLKEYDSKPSRTNADMFREVFPQVDSIDKLVKIIKNASERHCMMKSEWWDESYEDPTTHSEE